MTRDGSFAECVKVGVRCMEDVEVFEWYWTIVNCRLEEFCAWFMVSADEGVSRNLPFVLLSVGCIWLIVLI